ncbi:MAG: sarcosine oxidase subunit delta, partial [Granulosicoccaceae bacterium]
VRDHTEFTYGNDAAVARPPADCTDQAAWEAYVFERENPRGLHRELWQHSQGCRAWLEVERDTVTHEIQSIALAAGGSVSGGSR